MDSINTTSLWPAVKTCIEDLIKVKNTIKIKGATPDITKKIPFEIKSYRAWIQALEKPAPGLIEKSKLEETLEAEPYLFSKKLIARIIEINETGEIQETKQLASEYNISFQQNSRANPDDITNIEAIPKKLAEEGDRPGDDNPVEQRKYDLQKIWGIGPSVATKLEADGMSLKSLLDEWQKFIGLDEKAGQTIDNSILKINYEQVNKKPQKPQNIHERLKSRGCHNLAKLTHDQILGVKYFTDIGTKIPRNEIVKIEKILQATAAELNPNLIAQCCGSYRRGRARSGDVDCCLFAKNLLTETDVREFQMANGHILSAFAAKLTELGFLSDHLSCGDTKYMGLCKLYGPDYTYYRRIDIRLNPMNSFATTILYFTGSKNLNTEMRNRALARDMTLNEYGLYKFAKDSKGGLIKDNKGKNIKGDQILCQTEADVFKALGMKYLEPHERDI